MMSKRKQKTRASWLAGGVLLALAPLWAGTAWAGPIFLTGHDPDFHSQLDPGAKNLLTTGLNYVTGNTTFSSSEKFLWVESRIPRPTGHLVGEHGLNAIGLSLGVEYDRANAAEFASVNLADYTAIAIASSFGGLLTRAELDALINRASDIKDFINNGGGLFAASECYPCGSNLLAGSTAPDLFGYLPVDVTSIGAAAPFTPTAFGSALGLTAADLNSPTHNSFGLVGGLNVVDVDRLGNATTLAGVVGISGGGFTSGSSVPEPATLLLMGMGLAGIGFGRYRRNH